MTEAAMWGVWGKSNAAGSWHPLVAHLLDTAAVAELIWDDFLTPAARRAVDEAASGRGRDLLRLMAGWHDLGKATPAFQSKDVDGSVRAAALGLGLPAGRAPNMKHGHSGGVIANRALEAAGVRGFEWLLPLITGHHGSFRARDRNAYDSDWQMGPGDSKALWEAVQDEVAAHVAGALDIDLATLALARPSRMVQLALAGLISMADWIASSDLFPGVGEQRLDLGQARARAQKGWDSLGLSRSGEWVEQSFVDQFGFEPTPLQARVVDLAERMSEPGLLVVEAPMGAGKTEASLAAAQVLARRFGHEGLLYAMPTQGTSDAMYDRVRHWRNSAAPGLQLALLHGKAMANETWREAMAPPVFGGVCDEGDDPYGMADPFSADSTHPHSTAGVPSQWIIGRHRGLLSPAAVSTVDQPLMAATHVKYVSLRYAGLLGKVVVIDEVHSYDVFTGSYLEQFLRWCGDGKVPVILMSATLPPAQQSRLLSAYASGLGPEVEVSLGEAGYPSVSAWAAGELDSVTAPHVGRQFVAQVSWADFEDDESVDEVARLALDETADGGIALVIVNTVRRAQQVFAAVRDVAPAELLHSRLTTSERARRTSALVDSLGRQGARPERLIVVATQVAEQSFDVDADLLITDVAPMDLLLQRIGRLHRHARPDSVRGRHAQPRVVITGVTWPEDGPPSFVRAFEFVYDRYSLLRSAALIGRAGGDWEIPMAIPGLVAQAYDEALEWPEGWQESGVAAWRDLESTDMRRRVNAGTGLLKARDSLRNPGTLDLLHDNTGVEAHEERICVRDGEPSTEVALVRWDDARQIFTTLAGRPLGPDGERVAADVALCREVLGDTVRVREAEPLARARPLVGWGGVALLRDVPAVVLRDGRVEADWGSATYDRDVGLVIERKFPR